LKESIFTGPCVLQAPSVGTGKVDDYFGELQYQRIKQTSMWFFFYQTSSSSYLFVTVHKQKTLQKH